MEYLGTTLLTIILVVLFIYFTNKNILKKRFRKKANSQYIELLDKILGLIDWGSYE